MNWKPNVQQTQARKEHQKPDLSKNPEIEVDVQICSATVWPENSKRKESLHLHFSELFCKIYAKSWITFILYKKKALFLVYVLQPSTPVEALLLCILSLFHHYCFQE